MVISSMVFMILGIDWGVTVGCSVCTTYTFVCIVIMLLTPSAHRYDLQDKAPASTLTLCWGVAAIMAGYLHLPDSIIRQI